MKATLKARIVGIDRKSEFKGDRNLDVVGLTKLSLISSSGKVDTRLTNAQMATFSGDLFIKETIANEMKIGATITITVSDEEVDERIT